MSLEIERRWLLKDVELPLFGVDILQGYIYNNSEGSIRIRRTKSTDTKFYITVKTGKGLIREEVEEEIRTNLFYSLWNLTDCKLSKTRYKIPVGKFIAEVDIFKNELEGHRQVEVEFKSKEEARSFVAPDWFGIEVTEDRRYINAVLAKEGIPKEN